MRTSPCISTASLALAAALTTIAASGEPLATVVMSGLDSPRGLAFAPNGALFVVEAGHGGAPCPGTSGLNCYGRTGAVSRYWHGRQDRIATGLPSIAFPLGANARGPHDIAMLGAGTVRVTVGLEEFASVRDARQWDGLGWLVEVPASTLLAPPGHLRADDWTFVVDIAGEMERGSPARHSDPYAVIAIAGGYRVVDASANALLDVDVHGVITTRAAFPSRPERPTDSVPTSVAIGPDGAYYIGEFTGFPPPPAGDARVYRVAPGEPARVFCSGFNRIIDIAFDDDGLLYVLQYATTAANTGPGLLWRVVPPAADAPDPSCPDRQQVDTGVVLDQPTAIAFGPDGALYVSNRGARPGRVGEVLRIEP